MAKQTKAATVSGSAQKQKALLDLLDSIANLSKGAAKGPAAAGGGMQQGNLEALLARIFPDSPPLKTAATETVAAASPAAGAVAEAATGAAGKTTEKLSLSKIFRKGKDAVKTPLGKAAGAVGVAMLIDALVKGGLNIAGQVGQANLQGQALDAQMAANSPAAATERAMQPITKAQRDQAMMLLMRQMGMQTPNTAEGEVWT